MHRRGLWWVGVGAVSLAALATGCDESRSLPLEQPATGVLQVAVVTTGGSLDADGYQVMLDGALIGHLAVNHVRRFTDIVPGERNIRLGDVAANCSVDGGDQRLLAIEAGALASLTFRVECGVVLSIRPITSIIQHVAPNSPVSVPPTVFITDWRGQPLQGVAVDFQATGGGSVGNARALSDQDGLASCGHWIVGAADGADTLVVRVEGGTQRVFFYARAAATLARYDLESIGGRPLPQTYTVAGRTMTLVGGRLFFWSDGTVSQGYIYSGFSFDSTQVTGAYRQTGNMLTWRNGTGGYNGVTGTIAGQRLLVEYQDFFDFEDEVYLRVYGTVAEGDAKDHTSSAMQAR